VFIQNSRGRLTALCRVLGDKNVQMHALSLADTADYGVVRIICDDPAVAAKALQDAGFKANLTQVVAVEVPHVPGGLANVLECLEKSGLDIEYCYCFVDSHGGATVAFKVMESAVEVLEQAGFTVLHPKDLYKTKA
jgi:hypothetical protein